MTKHKKLIVLTAGGTGGHVYPADALSCELERRGYEVSLFTDFRGLNNYKGKLGEIENRAIYSGSVVGKSILTKIVSLFKVGIGVIQAGWYLLQKKPECVVGFGGYASFPTALAAIILRIPLVIHEQNSVMSRTNRILARFATLVAQSFRQVKNVPANTKTILTGMPIRESIASLFECNYQERLNNDKLVLLVLGGSQGAKIFAEVIPEAISKLEECMQKKLVIYQQCRKGEENIVEEKYEDLNSEVVVNSFFDNMPELYSKACLIISRSGASSVYEIAAAGLPSILIPLPTAADNHQYYNAKGFADDGGSMILNQVELSADKLASILSEYINNHQMLEDMSNKVKSLAIVDAAVKLADAVENIN